MYVKTDCVTGFAMASELNRLVFTADDERPSCPGGSNKNRESQFDSDIGGFIDGLIEVWILVR
jgi:hypothetical protein